MSGGCPNPHYPCPSIESVGDDAHIIFHRTIDRICRTIAPLCKSTPSGRLYTREVFSVNL